MLSLVKNWFRFNRLKKLDLALGKEINRIGGPDRRDDLLVVDLSRLENDLVGVRRRMWVIGTDTSREPEFGQKIEYVSIWKI